MTGRGRRARGLAGALWLAAATAAFSGCDDPPPPVSPSSRPEPADPFPVVSQCEGGTIRAGAPRRIYEEEVWPCDEEYEVDFLVEAGPGDAMLLAMFQPHALWNWRVEERGETVRHAFTLRMRPVWSGGWGFPVFGHRPHEPIVIQRCPEGNGKGPVLACTTTGCGTYEHVSEVPRLAPAKLQLAISLPPAAHHQVPIREGETVETPVTFRIYRPLPGGVTLTPKLFRSIQEYADVEVAPPEIHVPVGAPRTETRLVSVTVKRYDYERRVAETGIAGEARFGVHLPARGERGCVNDSAGIIQFRLLPPEGTGSSQSSSP